MSEDTYTVIHDIEYGRQYRVRCRDNTCFLVQPVYRDTEAKALTYALSHRDAFAHSALVERRDRS